MTLRDYSGSEGHGFECYDTSVVNAVGRECCWALGTLNISRDNNKIILQAILVNDDFRPHS